MTRTSIFTALLLTLSLASGRAAEREPNLGELARALGRAGVLFKTIPSRGTIEILPASGAAHPPAAMAALNELAQDLKSKAGIRLLYDRKFYQTHPYAAASFDHDALILYLPASVLLSGDVYDATLKHELVHVKIWEGLKNRVPSPYYGWMDGEPFKPDRLDLDEMEAYDRDLTLAIQNLQAFLRANPHALEVLAPGRLQNILVARLSEKPLMPGLTPTGVFWDTVAKKVLHGKWHTLPVLEYVPQFLRNLDPNELTFSQRSGITLASLKRAMGGKVVALHLYLVESSGLSDSQNSFYFRQQGSLLLGASRRHAERLKTLEAKLREIAAAKSAVEARDLILNLLSDPKRADPN